MIIGFSFYKKINFLMGLLYTKCNKKKLYSKCATRTEQAGIVIFFLLINTNITGPHQKIKYLLPDCVKVLQTLLHS